MTDEQKLICDEIVKHYGFEIQRDILVEECAELIQAVSKCKRNNVEVSDNFLEELADVSIMIEQMLVALFTNEIVTYQKHISRKLDRQIRRINGIPERGCDNCVFYGTCSKRKQNGYCGNYRPTEEMKRNEGKKEK